MCPPWLITQPNYRQLDDARMGFTQHQDHSQRIRTSLRCNLLKILIVDKIRDIIVIVITAFGHVALAV